MTTAPVLGQPAAAFPVAPRSGRAGLLVVPALVVVTAAVVSAIVIAALAVPGSTGVLVALAGLAVLLGSQAALRRPQVIQDLTVLRRLGVRVAVDDFGTGWSSLAYLVGMPVDVLKMDQYFLANVEHDPARRAMCRAVLQLGSSLGLPVIVGGVTNPAVLNLLRDMGHRYLQGYVFSRPLEAEQLADGAWEAWVELPALDPAMAAASPAESPAMPS